MIQRLLYTERILSVKEPSIKILTGMKRSGKTTILALVRDELAARGIARGNIIVMSFEGLENVEITDWSELYSAISARVSGVSGRVYVFLDEPQRIAGWERAALHLTHDFSLDLYVSGSSAAILSPTVTAILEDKYVVFPIAPLSFSEFLEFRESYTQPDDTARELARYVMMGGFPALHLRATSQEEVYTHVRDIMSAAIWGDVVGSHQLRRADQLTRIIRFILENVGKTFSAKRLSDSLKDENKEINLETVYTYLDRLEKAFIISRCRRYDLQAEEQLKTQEKFYLADPALSFAMLGFRSEAVGKAIENVVYLELMRRGYDVFIGKYGRREIDFTAIRGDERIYIQLGREVHPDRNELDAFRTLSALRDNYPKFILTTDQNAAGNRSGIRTVGISDFLLGQYGT